MAVQVTRSGDRLNMSSPDSVRVPLMNDTTRKEEECGSLWIGSPCYGRIVLLSPGILALLYGLPAVIVGVWALVQVTSYFSIATMLSMMQPTTSMIIVSGLLVIVGVVIVFGGIAHVLYIRFSGTQKVSTRLVTCSLIFVVLCSLPFAVITLGGKAVELIPSLSEANTTFNLSDQRVQENFANVQHNLKCCGVVAFTDYESIFNNLSVPVSCCNTTNPLANETTCPAIVSNARQANQTGLIYSEGCVPQLQSVLQYILSVIAGVGITTGVLQILGNGMCGFCLFCC